MAEQKLPKLKLETLANVPVIGPLAAGFYFENCIVCFDRAGHTSGITLVIDFDSTASSVLIEWQARITNQVRRAYGDVNRATDNAACAIALLLIQELTEFSAIEQSFTGTGIDYFLALKPASGNNFFELAAYLEVSGILRASPQNTVKARVEQKRQRLRQDDVPTIIVVVEFGQPSATVVTIPIR